METTFDPTSRKAGLGIIIRDYMGKVLLSSWKHCLRCGSVQDGEAAACLEGAVESINEWIRTPTVIESNCHNLVQALNSACASRASFSNFVKEIKSTLYVIPEVKVCKIGRECVGTVSKTLFTFGSLERSCSNLCS